MNGIFINYRREDSIAFAGRIYDRISAHFGKDRVFMDIDTIVPGDDFVDAIDRTCTSCGVVLALIGKQWAAITDRSGSRRLDNPGDFVRLEISKAIQSGVRVIPVLLDEAEMPAAESLPEDLRKLAFRHALHISSLRFHRDVDILIESVEKALRAASEAAAPAAPAQPAAPLPPASWVGQAPVAESSADVRTRHKRLLLAALLFPLLGICGLYGSVAVMLSINGYLGVGVLILSTALCIAGVVSAHKAHGNRKRFADLPGGNGMVIAGFILGYFSVSQFACGPIIAAIAIPNFMRSRAAANESSAVGSMRTINTAEVIYASTYPDRGFTCDLAKLGSPPAAGSQASADAAGHLDNGLTSGHKGGYNITLSGCTESKKQPSSTYVATASPATNSDGKRFFCTDQSGVIRSSTTSADDCTHNGTPVGQ